MRDTLGGLFVHADDGSYQVRNAAVRALEPGLTAPWLRKAGACCSRGGRVLDVCNGCTLAT